MAFLLIIDDDEDFAEAVATVCRSDGHDVTVEHDATLAEARFQERQPDAVVLDVMFPENPSAGFEIARALRKRSEGVPILMLTAVNQHFPLGFSSKDIDQTWLPVTIFLEKPIDFPVLRSKINELVNGGTKGQLRGR